MTSCYTFIFATLYYYFYLFVLLNLLTLDSVLIQAPKAVTKLSTRPPPRYAHVNEELRNCEGGVFTPTVTDAIYYLKDVSCLQLPY